MSDDREEQLTESKREKTPLGRRIWRMWQWLLAAPLLLLALIAALAPGKGIEADGAPVSMYFASVAALMVVGLLLAPPAFFRLPRAAKVGSYLAILGGLGFWGTMFGQVQASYEQTPEGARIAAERRAERLQQETEDNIAAEREAAKLAEDRRAVASAQREAKMAAEMDEREEKLNDCLSFWSGGIPDLIKQVRTGLHNPDAFEHVETHFIPVPDNNTTMVFRAENGFGAIRTGRVTATIDPDSCEVTSLGDFATN